MTTRLSRRLVLRRAAFLAAGTVVAAQPLSSPAFANPTGPEPSRLRSR
ncbi:MULTISPECIES: hypothetical protein [unclassified Streptomyces]|nr:hypothetical protein [Streptomyces sp. HSG2]